MCLPYVSLHYGMKRRKGNRDPFVATSVFFKSNERGTRSGGKDQKKKKSEDWLTGPRALEFGFLVFGRMLTPMSKRWGSLDPTPTFSSFPPSSWHQPVTSVRRRCGQASSERRWEPSACFR